MDMMEGTRTGLSDEHGAMLEGVPPGAFSHPRQLLAAYSTSAPVGLAIFANKLHFQAINSFLAKMNGIPATQQGTFRHALRAALPLPGKRP